MHRTMLTMLHQTMLTMMHRTMLTMHSVRSYVNLWNGSKDWREDTRLLILKRIIPRACVTRDWTRTLFIRVCLILSDLASYREISQYCGKSGKSARRYARIYELISEQLSTKDVNFISDYIWQNYKVGESFLRIPSAWRLPGDLSRNFRKAGKSKEKKSARKIYGK